MLILVLLLSVPGMGAELTKEAKREIVGEWSKKTGFARRDLNNVQILPNFRMSIRTDSEDLIPAGSKVAVIEVHLILDTPLGATLTDDQKSQLDAMWAKLVSAEPIDTATLTSAPEEEPDAGNRAVLHAYRAHMSGFGGSVPFALNCDGLAVGGLADSRYFTVDLQAGPHHCFFANKENTNAVSASGS
jgi:hypothetical protein